MIARKLSPATESLLAAQDRYRRLQEGVYRSAGGNLCDLGYANFHDGSPPAVLRVIRESLDGARPLDLQYTPYGGATITRRLIAERLSQSHGLRLGWRNVIMTPGAMAALNILFRAVRTDDCSAEVIIPAPCWLDYPLYVVNLGLRPVMVPLSPNTLRLDVDRIADAISESTRAIVFSQPANPTGRVYSQQELVDLATALKARSDGRILLISDECHRDTVFPGRRFLSPAEYYDNTCIVYSFGKAFQIQGQRIGYIAVSPRMKESADVARLLERLCQVTGFCAPTALMQLAVRRLLTLEVDIAPMIRRREFMVGALRGAGFELEPSDGTYFLYPQAPTQDDFQFVESLAQRGVLALPAAVFHHRGHFRISLTATESQIDKAAQVLITIKKQMHGSAGLCLSNNAGSSSKTSSGTVIDHSTSAQPPT